MQDPRDDCSASCRNPITEQLAGTVPPQNPVSHGLHRGHSAPLHPKKISGHLRNLLGRPGVRASSSQLGGQASAQAPSATQQQTNACTHTKTCIHYEYIYIYMCVELFMYICIYIATRVLRLAQTPCKSCQRELYQ